MYSDRRGTVTVNVAGRDERYDPDEVVTLKNMVKIRLPETEGQWTYQGESLLVVGTSGDVSQGERFYHYLNNGGDIADLIATSQKLDDLLGFTGMSAMGLLHDGSTVRMLRRRGVLRVDVFPQGCNVAIGSGSDILSATYGFFNSKSKAFDDFIAGAYLDEGCDLNFDYYDYARRKLITDNELSDRQVQLILKRVQSNISLYTGPKK
jgi:hypothetical protein